MLKITLSRQRGLRWCPLPQRNRILQGVRVRCATAGSSGQGDAPGEPVEFQFAPPQYPTQYYQAIPQPAPVAAPAPASTTPFWVWILTGVALHWIYTKVQEFRKNPMAAIAGMMGGAKPSMGASGGGGDMAQMMEMMQRMQQQQQAAGNAGAPGGYPFGGMPSSTTINTTASDVVPPAPETRTRPGSKFEENKKGSTNGGPSSPVSSQPETPTPPPSSFFSDTQTSATPSFFQDTSNSSSQTDANAQNPEQSIDMVDKMLLMVADNPELRKQLGVHLPESMNNESTWKWIKENPEMRRQMAKQISPGLAAQFGDMSTFNQYSGNTNNEDLMNQMKSMGVDPNEMMGKVMADPEVMQIMTKPHVAQALMEMQSNPASAINHMKDPDIFKLMQKMMEMNPALKNAGMPSS